ncbi:apolipoprotein N-acyltransferase [bacterium]|nr:MAG: apolipoprotein N-acyltransferase [bacterium]
MDAINRKNMNIYDSSVLLAFISGVMWALAYPPFPLGFLAFFMLVFLWRALENVHSGFQAVKIGYLWGLVGSLGTLWWISLPTLPGMIALVLFLPLYSALYAWIHYLVAHKHPRLAIVLSPIFLVAVEFLRSWGKLGFPWMNLSYTMTGYPVLIQFADIFGAFGVSLWVAMINSCIYFLLAKPFKREFFVSAIVLLSLVFGSYRYGVYRMNRNIEGRDLRIALLQGNIDPYEKWSPKMRHMNAKIYSDMIRSVGSEIDLCILPETATACYHRRKVSMFLPLVDAVKETGVPTLMGTLDFDDNNHSRYFNSAILVMPDGSYKQEYSKIQLVPFAEYIPLQDNFTFIRRLSFGGGHFESGDKYTVFKFNDAKFSVLICYESAFGWLGRRFRDKGAQFLVNITNDGWFGRTTGPYQHAMFNVMRAIENRVWIARCANTGISMFVDPYGRIIRQTKLFERTVLISDIHLTNVITIYDRIGDVIGWGSFFITPFLLLLFRK